MKIAFKIACQISLLKSELEKYLKMRDLPTSGNYGLPNLGLD